jgi:hypothetical protein
MSKTKFRTISSTKVSRYQLKSSFGALHAQSTVADRLYEWLQVMKYIMRDKLFKLWFYTQDPVKHIYLS